MKKLRSLVFAFKSSFKSSQSGTFLFTLLLAMLVFYSCSSDDESISKSGKIGDKDKLEKNTSSDKSKVIRGNSIQENVNLFSETIFANYGNLDYAIHQNLYVGFNAQTQQMVNNAQTENDLKVAFETAGIANSQEVIDILKNIVTIQQGFIANNPNFYNLTQEQQIEYLNSSVEIAKNNFMVSNPPVIPTLPFQTGSGCAHSFNVGISRCNTDYGVCGVFAVIGAAGGLMPGLIAAAYCITTKVICDKRVQRDFKDCEAKEYIKGGATGPHAILTLRCDSDSCWAVDYYGNYFARVSD